ncbi:hypothetical protein OROMI_006804 [Orobanche minor]
MSKKQRKKRNEKERNEERDLYLDTFTKKTTNNANAASTPAFSAKDTSEPEIVGLIRVSSGKRISAFSLHRPRASSSTVKVESDEPSRAFSDSIDLPSLRVQSSKDLRFKYDSDEKRTENRPQDIPLEDFKILLKYSADEGVQSLAEENAARRNSYADSHTLGRKNLAKVKEKLKKQDPNLASPSRARVYFKSRKHKERRKYKTNRDAIKKRVNYAMREKVNYLNSEPFDSSYRC